MSTGHWEANAEVLTKRAAAANTVFIVFILNLLESVAESMLVYGRIQPSCEYRHQRRAIIPPIVEIPTFDSSTARAGRRPGSTGALPLAGAVCMMVTLSSVFPEIPVRLPRQSC
jgi:hypothetical protein